MITLITHDTTISSIYTIYGYDIQVYGYGALNSHLGRNTQATLESFKHNLRVSRLLTPSSPEREFNSVYVQNGEVTAGSDEARMLLSGNNPNNPDIHSYDNPNNPVIRTRRSWSLGQTPAVG